MYTIKEICSDVSMMMQGEEHKGLSVTCYKCDGSF